MLKLALLLVAIFETEAVSVSNQAMSNAQLKAAHKA